MEIAARSGVTNLKVFGSVARGEDRADSDVDLVGDVAAGTGLFALGALRHDLEQLLGVPVDLAPADGLKPRVRAELERDAVPL